MGAVGEGPEAPGTSERVLVPAGRPAGTTGADRFRMRRGRPASRRVRSTARRRRRGPGRRRRTGRRTGPETTSRSSCPRGDHTNHIVRSRTASAGSALRWPDLGGPDRNLPSELRQTVRSCPVTTNQGGVHVLPRAATALIASVGRWRCRGGRNDGVDRSARIRSTCGPWTCRSPLHSSRPLLL